MFNWFKKKSPKVFCIGRNKTGTTTIKKTLEDFGYKLGDQREAELLNKFYYDKNFAPIIKYCKKADAFQDVPFSWPETYLQVYKAFPNAKFILTVRESSEVWYNSLVNFHSKIHAENKRPTVEDLKNAPYVYKGWAWENRQNVYGFTEADDPYDKEKWIKSYEKYNAEVIEFFKDKPNQLIVIDLSKENSYFELCAFLGKEPLYDNFPWENKTSDIK